MKKGKVSAPAGVAKTTGWARTWKIIRKNKAVYLMVLPVIIYYILFHYKPMYGIIISFMDYNPRRGVSLSLIHI